MLNRPVLVLNAKRVDRAEVRRNNPLILIGVLMGGITSTRRKQTPKHYFFFISPPLFIKFKKQIVNSFFRALTELNQKSLT